MNLLSISVCYISSKADVFSKKSFLCYRIWVLVMPTRLDLLFFSLTSCPGIIPMTPFSIILFKSMGLSLVILKCFIHWFLGF